MSSANTQAKFLSSWKEIANYMGKGVRTVQRYEVQLGLPVRRLAGKPRSSVIATRAEIDAWVAARPIGTALPPRNVEQRQGMSSLSTRIREMHMLREQLLLLREEHLKSLQLLVRRVQAMTQGAVVSAFKRSDVRSEVSNSADLIFIPHNAKSVAKELPLTTGMRRQQD